MDDGRVARIEQVWALNAAAFVDVLRRQDPSWKSETFSLAGGHAVLNGAGLYVNRAIAAGIDTDLTTTDLDRLELRSAAVGVTPAIEVSPATRPDTPALLAARRYRPAGRTAALIRPIGDAPPPVTDGVVIERADGELLECWQDTSALGWGHADPDAKRASDAFAAAAAVVDGDGFVLARSVDDGRPVGCASVTIRDGVATLGGMSTLPDERRRGIQAALIAHRLRHALDAGCDLICSSAEPGGASERNLLRHGFEPSHITTTYTLG